jgi:hypothetical protein
MGDVTARHALPRLAAGQGQKDVTHNEALEALDALLHPLAASRSALDPPETPLVGASWIVPAGAAGAWAGQAGKIAVWSEGGWRFLAAADGTRCFVEDEADWVRRLGGSWEVDRMKGAPAAAVLPPAGGTVVDLEARAAIVALLERMTGLGLLV